MSAKGKTRPGKNGGRLNTGGTYPGAGRPPKLPDLDKLLADVLGEEKNGRIGYGTEISPGYCDVIVKRWQDFTGQKAIHEASGKTFDELAEAQTITAQ